MRRLCLAACAALIPFAVSPAFAGGDCCWSAPTVVYAVPPTGYLLDPSDARPPIYVVNQGPVYSGPGLYAVPTYSEGGYAYPYDYPYDYPYVRSYYGDRWFAAPPPRRYYGWRHRGFEGRRSLDRVRVVRAGTGYGNVSAPYNAYDYRPARGARVIHVPQ